VKRITISTKVSPETVERINKLGFHISDTLQVGLKLFLDLPEAEQRSLILKQLAQKKSERARARFKWKVRSIVKDGNNGELQKVPGMR